MAQIMSRSILIVAGEASGDNVGGLLAAELKLLQPDLGLFGLGGDRMAACDVDIIYHANQLSFLGFGEVVRHLPFIRRVERDLLAQVDRRKPALAILIDYPGFNLRLARKLKEKKIPVLYYVSPQVWAWGKDRIAKIKRLVDKMAVVFQFEKEMYQKEGLPVEWFGHPLLEIVSPHHTREDFLKQNHLDRDRCLVGFFPGSRLQEIERLLPVMRKALTESSKSGRAITGIVGCAAGIDDGIYRKLGGESLIYLRGQNYDIMSYSEINLVASGTATLECAILGRPLIVLYKTSPITYQIARRLVKIPYIGLVNVVAGEKIVPELVQGDCRADRIAAQMRLVLNDGKIREEMLARLSAVRGKLGQPGASRKVAELALKMIGIPTN
jgi:lipid-A-disaccharide synthase